MVSGWTLDIRATDRGFGIASPFGLGNSFCCWLVGLGVDRRFSALSLGLLIVATVWAFTGSPASSVAEPGVRVSPDGVYNPVFAGESLPDGFRQLLPRDGIRPIYEPGFIPSSEVDWQSSTEVIGVSINDSAKAYPVSQLNGREMVVDELDGVPILVTW